MKTEPSGAEKHNPAREKKLDRRQSISCGLSCMVSAVLAVFVYMWLKNDNANLIGCNLTIALCSAIVSAVTLMVIGVDWFTGERFGIALAYMLAEVFSLYLIVRIRFIFDTAMVPHALLSCSLLVGINAVFCALYLGLVLKRMPLGKLSLILILVLGCVYTAIFRPFSIPDEETHYWAAYALSNEIMQKAQDDTEKSIVVRSEDAEMRRQIYKAKEIVLSDYPIVVKQTRLFAQNEATETVNTWRPTTVTFGYVFSALGITLGRLFHLGGVITFYLGRLFNLLAFAVCTAAAIRIIPYGKHAILGIAVLPMTIHLAASYSYDAVVLIGAFLFFAVTVRIANQQEVMSRKQQVLYCILAILVMTSKIVYFPLLLLAFLIPDARYRNKREKWLYMGIFFFGACAAFLLFQMGNVASNAVKTKLSWTDQPPHTLEYVLHHIPETAYTYIVNAYYRLDYYWASAVSEGLGWIQLSSSNCTMMLMSFLLMLCCLRCEGDRDAVLTSGQKVGVAAALGMIVFLVQFSLLLGWTPIGFGSIEGVQGRYFLPAFPLLLLLLRSNHLVISEKASRTVIFLLSLSSFMVIAEVIMRMF